MAIDNGDSERCNIDSGGVRSDGDGLVVFEVLRQLHLYYGQYCSVIACGHGDLKCESRGAAAQYRF